MSTWNQYVSEAKVHIQNIKSERLKVARLAILASKLPGTDMSTARFAKEIGVEAQSLQKWIRAYDEYRLKHPVKEPEAADFKPANKAATEKHAAGIAAKREAGEPVKGKTPNVIHISVKSKSFLADVNKLKDRLKLKGEVKAIEEGVRKELIVKLREVISLLERT